MAAHVVYALAWLSFGASHSLLAAGRPHAWLVRRFGRFHRLAFNGIAVVHVAAVWAVGWAGLGDSPAFPLPTPVVAIMGAVAVLGVVLLVVFLRAYDPGRLTGTAQMRGRGDDADEPLRLDGIHRWVRHPLYAAGFLVLWGRAVDPLGLATAIWASAYLVIGSLFEERKLLARFGAPYAEYRRRVPRFIPWKGRAC